MKNTLKWGAVLACVLGLVGCNGGGSGKSGAFLHVEQATPANKAAAVARNIKPQLIFSEMLDAASVNTETVQLLGPGGAVPVAITLTGNRLQLKPSGGLLPGQTEYTIRLGEGLRGRSGKKLEAAFNTRFTTVAQQWGTPETMPGDARLPHALMVEASGRAMLAWPESHDGKGYLMTSLYQDGVWGEAQLAMPAINGFISGVMGRTDGKGRFVLAWQQSGSSIFSATWRDGAWSEPVKLSASGYKLRMASNRLGTTRLVWLEDSGTQQKLMMVQHEGDGFLYAPNTMAKGIISDLDVTVGETGPSGIIWTQDDGETLRKRAYVIELYEQQYRQRLLGTGVPFSDMPTIVADTAGGLTAAWLEAEPGQLRHMKVAHFSGDAETSWSTPETLDVERTLYGRPLLLASAGARVTLIWNAWSADEGHYVLASARHENGVWGAFSDVPGSGPGNPLGELSAVVDAGGQITVAWWTTKDNHFRARYSRGIAGAWAAAEALGDGDDPNVKESSPRLGIDANGNIIAAWTREQGDNSGVRTRRYE